MKDVKEQKAEEQLHYFNISCGVDSIWGNWVVSKEGDVVNELYPYAIPCIHLQDREWMEYLQTKVWFKDVCRKDLEEALQRARKIKKLRYIGVR